MTRKEIKSILWTVIPCALLCIAGNFLQRNEDFMGAQVFTIAPDSSVALTSMSNSTMTLGGAPWNQQILQRNELCFINESGQDTGKVFLSTFSLTATATTTYGWPIQSSSANPQPQKCYYWGAGIPVYGVVSSSGDTQKLRVLITK